MGNANELSPSGLDGVAEVLVESRDVDRGEGRGEVLPGLHGETG